MTAGKRSKLPKCLSPATATRPPRCFPDRSPPRRGKDHAPSRSQKRDDDWKKSRRALVDQPIDDEIMRAHSLRERRRASLTLRTRAQRLADGYGAGQAG